MLSRVRDIIRRMKNIPGWILVGVLLFATSAHAQKLREPLRPGPYFLGYESEPSMDYGGRMIVSLHRGVSDLGAVFTRRFPYVAAAYEFPIALLISSVQHEVFGHGARAREYNLDPDYGFGLDASAYTTIDKDPKNNMDLANLCAGGTEADSVMAHRILLDLCDPDGGPACSIPLMFFAKMDFSLYVFSTAKPTEDSAVFTDDYESGNDIALYLVTRQAQRLGGSAVDVWNRDYDIDFDEPELKDTYNQMQSAAVWNMADPMMWASMFLYVRQHLIQGKRRTAAPALPLGPHAAITIGTRAAMSPDSVTRFADLYLLTDIGIFNVYGRDLQSTEQTTYGFGAAIQRLHLGEAVLLNLAGDLWKNPEGTEEFYDNDSGWNMSSEAQFALGGPVWLALKVGGKSEGFLPGLPSDSGVYGGAGVVVGF